MITKPSFHDVPTVGIIMPTYNGEQFIAQQLDSLLLQSGVSIHVYAFDDGSVDATVSILQDYSDRNPGKFTIVQNAENSGGTGLNVLNNMQLVPDSHDFFALADQDDVWGREKLSSAVRDLKMNGSDLYFSNLTAWDGGSEYLGTVKKDAPLRARDHLFGGGSAGCTYVFTKKFFKNFKNTLKNVDISNLKRISHDWIIYFHARHNGFNVTVSSESHIQYRLHEGGQYGGMALGGLGAIIRKIGMVRKGFLVTQVSNALMFARDDSEDQKTLLMYQRSWFGRVKVLLKNNFSLVRSNRRLFFLVVASLVFYSA